MTQGNALQNWQHIYQLSRLNIQRCITYTYVHVCGYLFSTVVCYGYVCLFVYTCTSACSCVYLHSCIDLLHCHRFVSHVLIFSYMYTYWTHDFWFRKGRLQNFCIILNVLSNHTKPTFKLSLAGDLSKFEIFFLDDPTLIDKRLFGDMIIEFAQLDQWFGETVTQAILIVLVML